MRKLLLVIPTGILSLLAIALVAYLSLWPDPLGSSRIHLFPGSDKVFHFLMYFGCTSVFLFDYAKHRFPHHTKINIELAITVAAVTLGLLMEVGQMALQLGRTFDQLDIVANTLGAFSCWIYYHFIGQRQIRHNYLYHMHYRRHRRN